MVRIVSGAAKGERNHRVRWAGGGGMKPVVAICRVISGTPASTSDASKMTDVGELAERSDAPPQACAHAVRYWRGQRSRLPAAAATSPRSTSAAMSCPRARLEQVPLGSSQEQVLIVLGTPSTVATVSGEAFYYISQRAEQPLAFMPQQVTNQRVIAVYFDKNRRVERLANYGLKDGKVFDFVSRTTPTSGAEINYLGYIFAITRPIGT